MNRCVSIFILAFAAIGPGVGDAEQSEQPGDAGRRIEYPTTRRVDHVDTYFGVKVPDPYRWLEDDVRQSKEVADWVAAENRVTAAYFESIPERETIRRRLTELWNFPQYSAPSRPAGDTT